jgi:hypothetical protein
MRRRRRGWIVLVCLLAVLLQGCPLAWRRVSINEVIKPDDVSFIVLKETKLAEIVQRLGTPNLIKPTETGSIVRYFFLDIKYFTVNLTRPLPFIFPVLQAVPNDLYQFTISGGGAGTEELEIGFDKNWTAVHYSFAHHLKASHYTP